MRYKNVAPEIMQGAVWVPVGLESFCVYPSLVPLNLRGSLPDPIQVNGDYWSAVITDGVVNLPLMTGAGAPRRLRMMDFRKLTFRKHNACYVDDYGEMTTAEEWILVDTPPPAEGVTEVIRR